MEKEILIERLTREIQALCEDLPIGRRLQIVNRCRRIRLRSRGLAKWRLNSIKIKTRDNFIDTVKACRKLSSEEDPFIYVIHREGVFGGPVVEKAEKPRDVTISESQKCVVVKDGFAYELVKSR